MITRSLLERIFSAASMERWNDHPHPAVFTELGKQAHKMAIAWVLGRREEDRGRAVDWQGIIQGGLYQFLYRVVVTDIRPPVFHKLTRDRETKARLDEWVASQLEPDLAGIQPVESPILDAAHHLATRWEFSFIYPWSAGMYGIEQTRREVESSPIPPELEISENDPLWGFISLVGQLAFQKRWARSPRVPSTSVLGHLFFVAAASWLLAREMGDLCPRRLRNNFFGGLFHDLPEVLTRDIISPVKAASGLDDVIRRYERAAMDERIYPLLPPHWHSELSWYTEEEFTNKTWQEGQIDPIQRHQGDIPPELNEDRYNPLDGRLIELCDKLAAYMEAAVSIRTGIHPPELEDAKRQLYERFRDARVGGMPVGYLFDYFR